MGCLPGSFACLVLFFSPADDLVGRSGAHADAATALQCGNTVMVCGCAWLFQYGGVGIGGDGWVVVLPYW